MKQAAGIPEGAEITLLFARDALKAKVTETA
jgi:hypothetical protein